MTHAPSFSPDIPHAYHPLPPMGERSSSEHPSQVPLGHVGELGGSTVFTGLTDPEAAQAAPAVDPKATQPELPAVESTPESPLTFPEAQELAAQLPPRVTRYAGFEQVPQTPTLQSGRSQRGKHVDQSEIYRLGSSSGDQAFHRPEPSMQDARRAGINERLMARPLVPDAPRTNQSEAFEIKAMLESYLRRHPSEVGKSALAVAGVRLGQAIQNEMPKQYRAGLSLRRVVESHQRRQVARADRQELIQEKMAENVARRARGIEDAIVPEPIDATSQRFRAYESSADTPHGWEQFASQGQSGEDTQAEKIELAKFGAEEFDVVLAALRDYEQREGHPRQLAAQDLLNTIKKSNYVQQPSQPDAVATALKRDRQVTQPTSGPKHARHKVAPPRVFAPLLGDRSSTRSSRAA